MKTRNQYKENSRLISILIHLIFVSYGAYQATKTICAREQGYRLFMKHIHVRLFPRLWPKLGSRPSYIGHQNLMIKAIKLKVDDIVCTGCTEDMETVLLDQDGILEAIVNFADDLIEIQYDASVIERAAVIKAAMGVANIREVISEQ